MKNRCILSSSTLVIFALFIAYFFIGSITAHAQTKAVTAGQPTVQDAMDCKSQLNGNVTMASTCTRNNADGSVTNCGGASQLSNSIDYCTIKYPDGTYTKMDANGATGSYTNYSANGKPSGANDRSISNGSFGLGNSATGTANNPSVTTGAATNNTPTTNTTANNSSFVSLTNIPGLFNPGGITNAQGLTNFFNQLYKICIGVAASLAVLQIIRAGFMYMGGDSITETKQARALIVTAIGGLVLVLSPVIVFSIINPKILNLQVGINNLTPSGAQATNAGDQNTCPTVPSTTAAGTACTPCNGAANSGIYEPGKGCIARTNGANYGAVAYPCGKQGCGTYESECTNNGGQQGTVTGTGNNQTFICNYPTQAQNPSGAKNTTATTYTCANLRVGCAPYESECINNGGTPGPVTGTGANQSFVCNPPAKPAGT